MYRYKKSNLIVIALLSIVIVQTMALIGSGVVNLNSVFADIDDFIEPRVTISAEDNNTKIIAKAEYRNKNTPKKLKIYQGHVEIASCRNSFGSVECIAFVDPSTFECTVTFTAEARYDTGLIISGHLTIENSGSDNCSSDPYSNPTSIPGPFCYQMGEYLSGVIRSQPGVGQLSGFIDPFSMDVATRVFYETYLAYCGPLTPYFYSPSTGPDN